MTNFVEFYKSTDQNMPPLSGQAGSLIKLLNALLVDGPGFTGVSVTSITRSGTTATATVSAADGLRLRSNMWITISGATGGDASLYNICAQITVASTTTFTYTMAGTPGGSATGTLLMAATMPVATITKSGTTATVTLTNADATLKAGMHVVIAGATGGDASIYNGTFSIATVTSTTVFTYTMGSTPASNAAGTLVYSRAGLAWTRPFAAGTNSQTYRSADATSNQFYLQVIDNAATAGLGLEAQIYGAEAMSADNTVTSGRFPTTTQAASGLCVRKATAANTTVREWTLWGDDRTFYMIPITGDGTGWPPWGFGYFISFKAGDGFNTFIGASPTFNSANVVNGLARLETTAGLTTNGIYCARSYAQLGSSVSAWFFTPFLTSSIIVGQSAQMTFPNPTDNGFYTEQLLITDTALSVRGRMPGLYWSPHQVPFTTYDMIPGINGLSGVTLTALTIHSGVVVGQWYADTYGPWS